jgi:ABC-2 type transport system ATP-binding protein
MNASTEVPTFTSPTPPAIPRPHEGIDGIRPDGGLGGAVRFDDVSRRFGDVNALDHVDLDLATGTTVALLGPNGAGKSTAIALMLGLLEPTSGRVRTLGLSPRDAVASGRVGSMLQTSGLPARVRVGELVEFVRRLYPTGLDLATILERSGLTGLAERSTDQLSGGESQRVRFALAIAGDPDLVFLDEPTVAMDVDTRRSFWADIRRSADDGRTILFATHYLEEADQVADRIIVLDHGRIIADGTGRSIRAGVGGRTVRFDLPMDGPDGVPEPARWAGLPGVSDVEIHGRSIRLATTDGDATVRALARLNVPFHDLEVTGADLEDAFVALVGTARSQETR